MLGFKNLHILVGKKKKIKKKKHFNGCQKQKVVDVERFISCTEKINLKK